MKKFTKILSIILALTIVCLSFASCTENKTGKIKIAIVQPISHTSLNQIRDTIIAELSALEGYDIEIITKNANGDPDAFSSIYANLSDADIVIPIATATSQSAKVAYSESKTPIVFAAVTNPVDSGLTGSDASNITGVSDYVPSTEVIDLVSLVQPGFKKLGLLYTSSEPNSVATMSEIKNYCDQNNVAYEEATITNLSELQAAVESLIAKGVDALYTNTDNNIATAMTLYTDVAYSNKIPVYCGADSMVSDGGFATAGVDYVQLGKQVASIVKDILDGKAPSDIPYQTLDEYAKFVNLKAAKTLGITLSEEVLSKFTVLVEEDGTNHFGE